MLQRMEASGVIGDDHFDDEEGEIKVVEGENCQISLRILQLNLHH